MRIVAVLVSLLAATGLVAAQQAQYTVEVRLIEIEARVTDRDGRPVTGLQRGDFRLRENNVPHDVATMLYVAPSERLASALATDPDDPTMAVITPQKTWIYVASEIGVTEVERARDTLRRFVTTQLQPGFQVSLGGHPFTDDRLALLQRVELLARQPFGTRGGDGLVDGTRQIYDDVEAERALAADLRLQEEGIVPLQGFFNRPERIETDSSRARQPYLTEGRIDRQLPMYGEVALRRYERLVERMAPLPGKKIVVLLRPGLRIEADNVPTLRRLASLSARRRVSFYTVDSRGLDAIASQHDPQASLLIDRSRRPNVHVLGKLEMHNASQEGLVALAAETHGRATLDTNRLTEVFDTITRDASGYYVLGYHPIDLTENGRYRRIRLSVRHPGMKIEATKGYYEAPATRPFGSRDGTVALRRGLLADLPTDLPVIASANTFAGRGSGPVLILSGGVPAGDLKPEDERTAPRFEATALVRIASDDPAVSPIHYERRLLTSLNRTEWRQLRGDRTAVLAMADIVPLRPGRYTWRIVVQDDNSGKIGGAEGQVTIPDFTGPSSSSSLLMTSEVLRRADPAVAGAAGGDDVLDAGPLRFTPQPLRAFRQGTLVHLRFDLYNPTAADLDAAPEGPRFALLKDGQPLARPPMHGDSFVDEKARRIHFASAIDTARLEPGVYTVLLAPPGEAVPADKALRQIFMLLPPTAN
jgi:VWFA-related protein